MMSRFSHKNKGMIHIYILAFFSFFLSLDLYSQRSYDLVKKVVYNGSEIIMESVSEAKAILEVSVFEKGEKRVSLDSLSLLRTAEQEDDIMRYFDEVKDEEKTLILLMEGIKNCLSAQTRAKILKEANTSLMRFYVTSHDGRIDAVRTQLSSSDGVQPSYSQLKILSEVLSEEEIYNMNQFIRGFMFPPPSKGLNLPPVMRFIMAFKAFLKP